MQTTMSGVCRTPAPPIMNPGVQPLSETGSSFGPTRSIVEITENVDRTSHPGSQSSTNALELTKFTQTAWPSQLNPCWTGYTSESSGHHG